MSDRKGKKRMGFVTSELPRVVHVQGTPQKISNAVDREDESSSTYWPSHEEMLEIEEITDAEHLCAIKGIPPINT